MGKRTRKPRGAGIGVPGTPDGPPEPDRNAAMRRGYARSEQRNEAIRQSLEPLKPGERPGAVTVAAIVAFTLGFVNIGLLAAGVEVADDENTGRSPWVDTIAFALVAWTAGYFMWKAKYWAVIGFQALLGVTLVIAGLSLPLASNLLAVVLCLTVLVFGGWLFWKLVRALARLQMPAR